MIALAFIVLLNCNCNCNVPTAGRTKQLVRFMACLAIWIFHINVCLNAVVSTLQAKECMLFAGTAVASGSGIAVVTSIGMETEIGKIQSQIAAASEEEESTPLKQKLDEFGELLAKVRWA